VSPPTPSRHLRPWEKLHRSCSSARSLHWISLTLLSVAYRSRPRCPYGSRLMSTRGRSRCPWSSTVSRRSLGGTRPDSCSFWFWRNCCPYWFGDGWCAFLFLRNLKL
jgi:hypothetical protein